MYSSVAEQTKILGKNTFSVGHLTSTERNSMEKQQKLKLISDEELQVKRKGDYRQPMDIVMFLITRFKCLRVDDKKQKYQDLLTMRIQLGAIVQICMRIALSMIQYKLHIYRDFHKKDDEMGNMAAVFIATFSTLVFIFQVILFGVCILSDSFLSSCSVVCRMRKLRHNSKKKAAIHNEYQNYKLKLFPDRMKTNGLFLALCISVEFLAYAELVLVALYSQPDLFWSTPINQMTGYFATYIAKAPVESTIYLLIIAQSLNMIAIGGTQIFYILLKNKFLFYVRRSSGKALKNNVKYLENV